MLEQLGISREVGLWLAARLSCAAVDVEERGVKGLSKQQQTAFTQSAHGIVLGGMEQYHLQQQALMTNGVLQPHTAALHLSVSAIALQWLSDFPDRTLLGWPESCNGMCRMSWGAYKLGQSLLQVQGNPFLEQQQPEAGDWDRGMAANQRVAQLGALVADRMMSLRRGLSDDAAFSTGSSGSSTAGSSSGTSAGSSGSSNDRMLMQSCQHVVKIMATAVGTAADFENATAGTQHLQSDLQEFPQLPVEYAQCCKLLQDCVRLAAAAAAAAAPLSNVEQHTTDTMLESVASLLGRVEAQSDTVVTHTLGPLLVIAAAAAGDVSSPEALQLFGLLCSLLKKEHASSSSGGSSSSSSTIAVAKVLGGLGGDKDDVSTSVLAAVISMLGFAMKSDPSQESAQEAPSSCSSSSSSSSSSISSTVAAALPWLVLLGRCCRASAVLVQRWQGSMKPEGHSLGGIAAFQHYMWMVLNPGFAKGLKMLACSLEDVAQWLAAAGTEQELSASGYQPQDLQQHLAEAAQALSSLTCGLSADGVSEDSVAEVPGPAVVQAAQAQLHAASRALACFAIPHACNNPACRNVSGPSEAQLVGGRSCICAGCRTARYCGKACQRAAWRQHKPVCQALAVAAATAAGAAAAAAAGAVAAPPTETSRRVAEML
jgi:hypothetical protein